VRWPFGTQCSWSAALGCFIYRESLSNKPVAGGVNAAI
jgi:hypothetical protein